MRVPLVPQFYLRPELEGRITGNYEWTKERTPEITKARKHEKERAGAEAGPSLSVFSFGFSSFRVFAIRFGAGRVGDPSYDQKSRGKDAGYSTLNPARRP